MANWSQSTELRLCAWLIRDRSLIENCFPERVHVQIASGLCTDQLLSENEAEPSLLCDIVGSVRHATKRVHCTLMLLLKALFKGHPC